MAFLPPRPAYAAAFSAAEPPAAVCGAEPDCAAWCSRSHSAANRVATIRFGLSLVFEISTLLAEIKAGKLVALHSGRCEVTGALAIQDINVITRQAHVDMPGMIPLHEGIRLLPAHDYPADHAPGPPTTTLPSGR